MKPDYLIHTCDVQHGRARESHLVSYLKLPLMCPVLAGLILVSGCTTVPGRYVLNRAPTESTKAFKNIGVAKVEVGTLEDQVDSTTPLELEKKLIEEIGKKRIFESVTLDRANVSALEIQPKIVEFHKGSQAARYFGGAMAGESAKARMDVQCKFINKETGQLIAQGVFTGEIAGGLFGGSANQSSLATYVAQHVANFLSEWQKGKTQKGKLSAGDHEPFIVRLETNVVVAASAPLARLAPKRVRLAEFGDQCSPAGLGARKAGFGGKMNDIVSAQPPAEAIREALKHLCAQCGHTVIEEPADLEISGAIKKCSVETPMSLTYWRVNATMEIELCVTNHEGAAVHSAVYSSQASRKTMVWVTETMVQQTCNEALANLLLQVAADPNWTKL